MTSTLPGLDEAPPADSAANAAAREPLAHPEAAAAFAGEIHTPEAETNNAVPCDLIIPDPNNRDQISEKRIAELAASIEAEGLLQPVVLRLLPDGRYQLMAGEHRWRAHLLLQRPTIPARIYRAQTDLQAARKKAIENFQRQDLTPVEEAKRFKELSELGMSQREIGAMLGRSQPVVANAIRMLALPPAVLAMVSEGELTAAHAVVLAKWAPWPQIVTKMARCAVDDAWGAKQLGNYKVPFDHYLVREGLVEAIHTRSNSWDNYLVYEIPKALADGPDFIKCNDVTFYLREPGRPDKWAPERDRQDAARTAKEVAKKKRDEKAKKAGKPSKEQKDRAEKLAKNKAARAKIAETLTEATSALKEGGAKVTADAVGVLLDAALSDGRHSGRLEAAAAALGVKLPKGLKRGGIERFPMPMQELRSLGDDVAVRLAALTIVLWQSETNARVADEVPLTAAILARHAKAEKPAPPKPATPAAIAEATSAEVKRLHEEGKTGAEIAKLAGISLPSVHNIKKALGLLKPAKAKGGRK